MTYSDDYRTDLAILGAGFVLRIALSSPAMRVRPMSKEERQGYSTIQSETVPCDKRLGTGRAPKEGNEWSAEHIARFAKPAIYKTYQSISSTISRIKTDGPTEAPAHAQRRRRSAIR